MGAEILLSVPPSSVLCTLSQERTEYGSTHVRINSFWKLSSNQMFPVLRSDCRKSQPVKDKLKNAAVGKKSALFSLFSLSSPFLSSCNMALRLACDHLAKGSMESNGTRGSVEELLQGSSAAADTSAVPGLAAAAREEAQPQARKREHVRGRGGLKSRASKCCRKA